MLDEDPADLAARLDVPEPLSPRNRSRVEQWDRGAGADVRQSYRTFTCLRVSARVQRVSKLDERRKSSGEK
jgi:hypothetical protein